MSKSDKRGPRSRVTAVRLIRAWRGYRAGAVLTPPAGMRKQLVDNRLAEIVEPRDDAELVGVTKSKRARKVAAAPLGGQSETAPSATEEQDNV